MTKQEIINYTTTAKNGAVKLQVFEAASALRSIENTFKGQFGEMSRNPTVDNLSMLLKQYIDRTNGESKAYLKGILRDLKIDNLLK